MDRPISRRSPRLKIPSWTRHSGSARGGSAPAMQILGSTMPYSGGPPDAAVDQVSANSPSTQTRSARFMGARTKSAVGAPSLRRRRSPLGDAQHHLRLEGEALQPVGPLNGLDRDP